jgi:hypothetical protein
METTVVEPEVSLTWWQKVFKFSIGKKLLLILSAGICLKGLWAEIPHPEMLKFTLSTTVFVELWVALNGWLKGRAKTKEAELIAIYAMHTAFAVLVSNELAFVLPYIRDLLSMKSFQAAQFFAGYGFLRWLFSTKEDGRDLALKLLVWVGGSVAGGGVAINLNSASLQMSWSRDYLAFALAWVTLVAYFVAQKWGDPLPKGDITSATVTMMVKVERRMTPQNGGVPVLPMTDTPSGSSPS